MRNKGVLLLEANEIITILLFNALYLAIGRTYANLTADTPNLIYQEFKDGHYLAHGQFVNSKIGKTTFINPKLPTLTIEAINKLGTSQKLAHNHCQKLTIAFAIQVTTCNALHKVTEVNALIKDDFLFCSINFLLAQKLPLASSS